MIQGAGRQDQGDGQQRAEGKMWGRYVKGCSPTCPLLVHSKRSSKYSQSPR